MTRKLTDFSDRLETWRDVDGWPYQVSSKGRVRSLRAVRPHVSGDGYKRVHFYDGERIAHALVHRLVAEAFIGKAPSSRHVVSHINGDPSDNRPANLEWATAVENAKRRKDHGNYATGENAANAKLTNKQADAIRLKHRAGASVSALSREYGVARPSIKNIILMRAYRPVGSAE